MPLPPIPPILVDTIRSDCDPMATFETLLPLLGELLSCDRCFLYVRHPQTRIAQMPACWQRSSCFPDLSDLIWKREDPNQLEVQDPLVAAALACKPNIYIDDIETASPTAINLAYEREQFGHRALAHIHLIYQDQLWGILEPCVFDSPRQWTDFDRTVLAYVREQLSPLVADYVVAHCPQDEGDLEMGEMFKV